MTTRMQEHKLARRRPDPISHIGPRRPKGQKFNPDSVDILDRATTKHPRETLEAWYSSNNSNNRHIVLDPVCPLVRDR